MEQHLLDILNLRAGLASTARPVAVIRAEMFAVCVIWHGECRKGGRMREEIIQGLDNAADFRYSICVRIDLQGEIPW